MAKIIISMPDELLGKVRVFCKDNNFNVSELIRYALRNLLERKARKRK